MSTIDRKLTDDQKDAIEKALSKHRISTTKERFVDLFRNIEEAWGKWEYYKRFDRKNITGRTDMLAEIKRLRNALKKSSPATRRALVDCSIDTSTLVGLIEKMRKFDQAKERVLMVKETFDILIEACNEAIERGGPLYKIGGNAIDNYSKKAGRPKNRADVNLVKTLGMFYSVYFNEIPAETPFGAFDDFLSAVFNAIDPRREQTSFRKLIRTTFSPLSSLPKSLRFPSRFPRITTFSPPSSVPKTP